MPPTPSRARPALCFLLAFAALAAAQKAPTKPTTPHAPWVPIADLTARGWDEAERFLGAGWQVRLAADQATPEWVIGAGLGLGRTVAADEDSIALARSLLERLAGLLRVDAPADFVLDRAAGVPNPWGQELVTIQFRQTREGLDVRTPSGPARVQFTFNGTLGRLVAFGSEAVADLQSPQPLLPMSHALAAAIAHLPGLDPVEDVVSKAVTYVYARPGVERLEVGPVHEVQVQTAKPAHLHVLIFDAVTGALVEQRDDLRTTDITGNVAAGVWDDSPAGSFSTRPMRTLRVDHAVSGNAYTDAAGDFTLTNAGESQVNVSGRFLGSWSVVNDSSGNGNLSFDVPATPGVPLPIILNPLAGSEYETAEATAYHTVTATRFFVHARFPSFGGMASLPTNVNINNTCNAYWNGSSVNFFRAGGGCNNTAYEEVAAHEYGHGFHQWFHGSTNPGGFSEGIGDHLGLYLSSRDAAGNATATQRVMGRDFFTGGGVIRDYRAGGGANNTQWPCSGCEVHKAGEIWGGFLADLRDNLVASLGLATGANVAETITIGQYVLNPADEPAGVNGVFLQDDNDGNLSNGTPHFADIAAAADRHSLPRPSDPHNLTFDTTGLPWSQDLVNAFQTRVTITSSAGTITAAQLRYTVNGGSEQSVVLSPTGTPDEYGGAIPSQAAGSKVVYWFTAQDTGGSNESSDTNDFHVSRPGPITTYDFEAGASGWTVAGSATTGQWEWGNPEGTTNGGTPSQSEDDHSPGGGVNCFCTGRLAGANAATWDLDGGPVYLVSPTWDLSGATAAEVSFWYWFQLFSPLNDTFRVDVSNDNGSNWTPAFTQTTGSGEWREARIDLGSVLPLTSQMKIRFVDQDNPNDSVNEGAVDDVTLYIADTALSFGASTPTPQIGTTLTLNLSVPGMPGSFAVLAISETAGPVYAWGIGTLALGDPVYLLTFASLDGTGAASVPVPIPNDGGFVGLTVRAQTFVTTTELDLLTNPVAVTFTGP
jgi:hypothetical protein